MTILFNGGGSASSIDTTNASRQAVQAYHERKAVIDAAKIEHFGQLASSKDMPKNHGKTITAYRYFPVIDDRNANDQGLNATGSVVAGNLYANSKNVNTIADRLPTLGEVDGKFNRIGFSRALLEASLVRYGLHWTYSDESIQFDSDSELLQHYSREGVNAATEVNEASLQLNLLNAAGVMRFTGAATSTATVEETVTYKDLIQLSIDLDRNRCPKSTKVLCDGTSKIDTRTVPHARVIFIGPELQPTLYAMLDSVGKPAFVGIEKYAAGVSPLVGEIGSIAGFRVIVNQEMFMWEAAGAAQTNPDLYGNGSNYNVYPMLVVGDESFTHVGFRTGKGAKQNKFVMRHSLPGSREITPDEPYGIEGVSSIQWYQGTMILCPERIAMIQTTAAM